MLVIRRRGNGEFIFEERRPPQQNLLTLIIIALIFLSFQVFPKPYEFIFSMIFLVSFAIAFSFFKFRKKTKIVFNYIRKMF